MYLNIPIPWILWVLENPRIFPEGKKVVVEKCRKATWVEQPPPEEMMPRETPRETHGGKKILLVYSWVVEQKKLFEKIGASRQIGNVSFPPKNRGEHEQNL